MSLQLHDITKALLFDAFTVIVEGVPQLFSAVRAYAPNDDEEDWTIVLEAGGVEYLFATHPAGNGVGNKVSNAVRNLNNLCCV